MICSLGEILVVSDMDGTLLTPDQRLLDCNLSTIKLFTRLGGRFTVATGRTAESVLRYEALVPYLAPGIVYNGCVLYDFANHEPLMNKTLPGSVAKLIVRDVLDKFPGVGLLVYCSDFVTYLCTASHQTGTLFDDEKVSYRLRPVEDLPEGWNKLIFAADAQTLSQVEEFVAGRTYSGVDFVMSSPIFFEALPQQVDKGTALVALAETLDIPLKNTFAIGDYYNDIGMMKTAGHAVAMKNAPADIRLLADEVTDSCEDGGVGQFLYKLIQRYG